MNTHTHARAHKTATALVHTSMVQRMENTMMLLSLSENMCDGNQNTRDNNQTMCVGVLMLFRLKNLQKKL